MKIEILNTRKTPMLFIGSLILTKDNYTIEVDSSKLTDPEKIQLISLCKKEVIRVVPFSQLKVQKEKTKEVIKSSFKINNNSSVRNLLKNSNYSAALIISSLASRPLEELEEALEIERYTKKRKSIMLFLGDRIRKSKIEDTSPRDTLGGVVNPYLSEIKETENESVTVLVEGACQLY